MLKSPILPSVAVKQTAACFQPPEPFSPITDVRRVYTGSTVFDSLQLFNRFFTFIRFMTFNSLR